MGKKKTRATIGIATLGTVMALGYAYMKHNEINNGLNRLERNVDEKRFNFLRWKDNTTLNTLIKAEKKIKDLQDRTTSVRDIAWG